MKPRKEPVTLTMADWKSASKSLLAAVPEDEKRLYINDLVEILRALNLGTREKLEKELVFNGEAWRLLDNLFNKLNKKQKANCALFANMHASIREKMQTLRNVFSMKTPVITPVQPAIKPEFPQWYLRDVWMKNVFDSVKASSVATFSRTSRFFNEELKPLKFKKLEEENHPVVMFKGMPHDLLTAAHFRGLKTILGTTSGRFSAANIIRVTQVTDKSGKLKSIGLYCKKNDPGWLGRCLNLDILNQDQKDGIFYAEFDQNSVRKLNYAELDKKFNGQLPMQLADNHLETLVNLDNIIENCVTDYINTYCFENRMSNYDPETEVASGELQSIMLKITLHPGSRRALLKTMDDFMNTYIPAFKNQLGEDNFNRLVKNYGQAVDGSAFIEFNVVELQKGLDINPGSEFEKRLGF